MRGKISRETPGSNQIRIAERTKQKAKVHRSFSTHSSLRDERLPKGPRFVRRGGNR